MCTLCNSDIILCWYFHQIIEDDNGYISPLFEYDNSLFEIIFLMASIWCFSWHNVFVMGETILRCIWCIFEHLLSLMITMRLCSSSLLNYFSSFSTLSTYHITFYFIFCYLSCLVEGIFLWHVVDLPWWFTNFILEVLSNS